MQHTDRATAAVAFLLYAGGIAFLFAVLAGIADYIDRHARRRNRG